MNSEQIIAIYEQVPDSVYKLVSLLTEQVSHLQEQVKELQRQLEQNSRNSS